MGNPAAGWTRQRRQRQSKAIRSWRPWEKSTGPRSAEGKAKVARNADKGGEWRRLRAEVKEWQRLLRQQRAFLNEAGGRATGSQT